MVRFIFIRHGQSEANLKRVFAGFSDFPLTDTGLLQAELTAQALLKYKIDAVYASDLKRAYVTGEKTAAAQHCPIYASPCLREINAGAWEAMSFQEIDTKYHDDFYVWNNDIGHACPTNGESVIQLRDRILSAIYEIAQKEKNKTICIATHATPIRVCEASAGKDFYEIKNIPFVFNASYSIYDYEG